MEGDKGDEDLLRALFVIGILIAVLLAAFLCGTHVAGGQETHQPHQHLHEASQKLGRVNFPVSCTPQAQRQFNRAVAWLHSFEYEEAEKAFTEVTVTDPRCGMGYWGIAMSNYHSIWAPPTAAELRKGSSAVEKAKTTGALTRRERDYIQGVAVFYQASDRLDHKTRTFAYSEAMKQLYQRYPSDREAAVFYALTLIATGMMENDKSYTRQKQAAQILNRVLEREPRHPGVTHYLIHSYDYPALAGLALPAARGYAKIAPASAHAQHMPSHIFIRLGLWPEAIRSNLDAQASARDFAVRNHLSGVWDEEFHAMDYLAYSYLQGAQDKQASELLAELSKIQKAEPQTFKVAYAFTAIPARYALERRQCQRNRRHWDRGRLARWQPGLARYRDRRRLARRFFFAGFSLAALPLGRSQHSLRACHRRRAHRRHRLSAPGCRETSGASGCVDCR